MTNTTNENQMLDPSLVGETNLADFNPTEFGDLDNINFFDKNGVFNDSILEGFTAAAPTFDDVDFSGVVIILATCTQKTSRVQRYFRKSSLQELLPLL